METDQEMETKIFNSAALIIVIYLKAMIIFNLILGQYFLALILLVTSAVILAFYLIGRSKQSFNRGITFLSLLGYPIIAIVFFYNDGIAGPAFYIFLMIHTTILAVTQIKTYWFWGLYNLVFFLGLFYMGIYHADLISITYTSSEVQYLDHSITYTACLAGIVAIIIALKWNYQKQKQQSERNGEALRDAIQELSQTNEQKK